MGLAISELIKQVAVDLALEEPQGAVVTSTDTRIKQLLQHGVKTCWELRDEYNYPQLKLTHSFDTVAGKTSYSLPSNFWKIIPDTMWNNDDSLPIQGPLTDQEYNYKEKYSQASQYDQTYRVFGAASTRAELIITPEPDANETITFDYIRSDYVLPKLWEPGETGIQIGDKRSSFGNIYSAVLPGTSGGIPPQHTSGSLSDGNLLWGINFDTYSKNGRFQLDTDITPFEDDIMILGIIWRYLARTGKDYQKDQAEYYSLVEKRARNLEGAPILRQSDPPFYSNFTYRDDVI